MNFEKTYISNAKINLGLSVPFRYENGYHHIVSIFAPVDLCDELIISITPSLENNFILTWENQLPPLFNNESTSLVFTTDYKNNLVYKAWQWMNDYLTRSGINPPPHEFRVHLKKRIPSPAGLGGGSSNAAVIIKALLDFIKTTSHSPSTDWELFMLNLEKQCLVLGSDIPFFLYNKPALISGTGEIFKRFPDLKISGILGIPTFGFSTKQMYQSMKKPVFHNSRDKIIASLLPYNLISEPKKSLHGDNLIIHNLYTNHQDHLILYELLNCDELPDQHHLNMGDSLRELIHIENNGMYFLNNEFIGISKMLFPDKYLIIENIRRVALERISQHATLLNVRGNLISSMSGSGATIYVGLTGIDGLTSEFQQNLDVTVASLQESHPDVYWVKFCTLTS